MVMRAIEGFTTGLEAMLEGKGNPLVGFLNLLEGEDRRWSG